MSGHTWWKVLGEDQGYMFIDAPTRGTAKWEFATVWASAPGVAEEDFLGARARRCRYLDDYDDPEGPDALMARLRHGDWVPDAPTQLHLPWPGGFLGDRPDLPEGSYDTDWDLFNSKAMRDEADYRDYAAYLGARYPDQYRPKEA